MKYRTIVRLALRLLGIYLLAKGLPDFIQRVAFGLYDRFILSTPGAGPMRQWGYPVISLVQVLIAVYLVVGAKAILNRMLPSDREYCRVCGANLGRAPSTALCPDCGATPETVAGPSDRAGAG